jgi:hypothetical protein
METTMLPIAALYQTDMRLLIAAALFVVFLGLLPWTAPRPLAVTALLPVIAAWDFGATLIWGTGGPTKVRFDFLVSGALGNWCLLAVAVVGIVASAVSLRAFARGKGRLGTLLAGASTLSFVVWSCAVRYPPIVAVIGLLIIAAAFWWAASPSNAEKLALTNKFASTARSARARVALALSSLLPFVSGFIVYACLEWGPTGSPGDRCWGSTLIVPVFIAALAMPGIAMALSSRAAGKRTEVVVSLAAVAVLSAAALCFFASLCWFGQNMCGE